MPNWRQVGHQSRRCGVERLDDSEAEPLTRGNRALVTLPRRIDEAGPAVKVAEEKMGAARLGKSSPRVRRD
jgi:hypothetical protein